VTNGGSTAYEDNRLNQYTRVNGIDFTYDKNGNLTFDGVYHYYYDCENRLTEVNDINNQRTATYKYDFKGRRVAKTVGSTTTTFVYDGDQIIQDYRNGYRYKTYYYGTGIDELIRMIGADPYEPGTTYYYDGLGSVIALADYMGNVVEKYSYDVFGKPTIRNSQGVIRTTSAYGNRNMFTGREFETETGLYYYRARYYNPQIGRFIQIDPTYHIDGINLYKYARNNPIKRRDPFGLMGVDPSEPPAPPSGGCCKKYQSRYDQLGMSLSDCIDEIMPWPCKGMAGKIIGGACGGVGIGKGIGWIIIGPTIPIVCGDIGVGCLGAYLIASESCNSTSCVSWGSYNACGKCQ